MWLIETAGSIRLNLLMFEYFPLRLLYPMLVQRIGRM